MFKAAKPTHIRSFVLFPITLRNFILNQPVGLSTNIILNDLLHSFHLKIKEKTKGDTDNASLIETKLFSHGISQSPLSFHSRVTRQSKKKSKDVTDNLSHDRSKVNFSHFHLQN